LSRKFEDYQEMSFVLTALEKVLSNTGLAYSFVVGRRDSSSELYTQREELKKKA